MNIYTLPLRIIFFLIISFHSNAQEQKVLKIFKSSPYFKDYENSKRYLASREKTVFTQDPLRLTSNYNFTKPLNNNPAQEISSNTLGAALTYQNESSFSASLETSFKRSKFDSPLIPDDSSLDSTASIITSYNVLKNKKMTPQYIQRSINKVNLEIEKNNLNEQAQSRLTSYFQDALKYHNTKCKIRENKKIIEETRRTISKGKALFKANQISKSEYLNFIDLSNNIKSKIINLNNELVQARTRLSIHGVNTVQEIDKNLKKCLLPAQIGKKLSWYLKKTSSLLKKLKIEKNSNTEKNLIIENRLNSLQLKLSRQQNKADLTPFIRADFSRSSLTETTNKQITIGANYGFSVKRNTLRDTKLLLGVNSRNIAHRLDINKQEIQNQLNLLSSLIKSNIEIFKIQNSTINSLNELIQYYNALSKVRSVNSLSFNNTFIRKSDTINNIFDLIYQVESNYMSFFLRTNGDYIEAL